MQLVRRKAFINKFIGIIIATCAFAAVCVAQETAQKAAVGAGEMYDLLHKREVAVKRYQTALAVDASSDLAQMAKKRLKEPYTGG